MKKIELENNIKDLKEGIKNNPNAPDLKTSLKETEEVYRYHYEGGKRPTSLVASSNSLWLKCKKCPWERQLTDEENEKSHFFPCDNCNSSEFNLPPSTDRKQRTGKSFIDGKI